MVFGSLELMIRNTEDSIFGMSSFAIELNKTPIESSINLRSSKRSSSWSM